TELEAALTGLAPAPPRLDRDSLLYAAGRSAGARRWKQAASALALAAVGLAVFMAVRPIRERVVIVQAVTPTEPKPIVEPTSPGSSSPGEAMARAEEIEGPKGSPQLEIRWRMLRWGADSVPISVVGPERPTRSLEQDLDLPPGSLNGADGRHNGVSPPG